MSALSGPTRLDETSITSSATVGGIDAIVTTECGGASTSDERVAARATASPIIATAPINHIRMTAFDDHVYLEDR